jgi:phospholipid/cholesterol/gamma-HCH transport system substrate-binding protein
VLQDGDAIDRSHTSTAPTVEDTLASASLLVNGGGLAQSETIVEELNNALGGREQTFRQSLTQITDFLRQANQSTRQIDQVLFALRDVSKVLDRRRSSINAALTELRPAARVLHDNTDELVAVLQAADRVSVRSNALMTATRDDFLQVLRQLGPILDQVLATKPIYADSLRNVLRADVLLKHAIPGDYFPVEMMIRPDLGGLVRSPVAGGAEQSPDSSGADLLAELLGLLPGTGEPTPGPLAGLTGGGSGVGGEPSEGTSDSGGGSSDPLGELLGSGLGGGR